MSLEVEVSTGLRREIWKSMISMLRSYIALAGLNDGVVIEMHPTDADESDAVFFESGHATLSLIFDAATGNGTWTLEERDEKVEDGAMKKSGIPLQGTFAMGEDGSLFMNHELIELDMVAIDLVSKLVAIEHAVEG